MDNTQLPPGFTPIDDVIKEINEYDGAAPEDTAVLDITGMVSRHRWIEPLHNFRIRYTIFYRDDVGRMKKKSAGSKWVQVRDNYEAEMLKRALANKFRELSGQEFDMSLIRRVTTDIDPDNNPQGRPMANKLSKASVGDEIRGGSQVVTGEGR